MFVEDNTAAWSMYRLLFEKWNETGMAEGVRERIKTIASMVPPHRAEEYVEALCERAWDLFRDMLYDEDWCTDAVFSFDLVDDAAPHYPISMY